MNEHPHHNRMAHSSSPQVLLDQLRELNEFERDLGAGSTADKPLRLIPETAQRPNRTPHRWWLSLGGMAVAATLLIAFMMNQQATLPIKPIADTTPPHPGDTAAINHTVQPAAHASVLLTIVEGSDPATGLPCVSCRTVDLVATDGREQTLLAHAEPAVIQDAMNRTCSPSARRVVVVGLSGPAKSLPSNEAQATQLAQCIMAAPGAGSPGSDASIITNAATACMPESVSVRVWAGSR
ncbi:MAG: hypothetical protein KGS45_06370 [Planctomycetes bacterium]|nr:hypothetical protein [Planctomycetota bacterium]